MNGYAGAFRVGFYFSTSSTYGASAIYSGSFCANSGGLAASMNWLCNGNITIPSSLSPGTYYLFAMADDLSQVAESNQNNNSRAADTGTVVLSSTPPPASPDLRVSYLTAPTSGTIGGNLASVSATVRNQGTASAGSFRVGFYFSTSATYGPSAVFSGWSCTNSSGLAASANWACSGPVGIPSSLSPGAYYLYAVADDLSQVAESDENNNSRAADTGRIVLSGGS